MFSGRRALRSSRLAWWHVPRRPRRLPAAAAAAAAVAAAAVAGRIAPNGCEEAKKPPSRLDSWQSRWSQGQTGWHLKDVNPVLKDFCAELLPDKAGHDGLGPRVLFPLCGKTLDMPFLAAEGYRVVGVEGIEAPLHEFAAEHGATGQLVPVALPPDVGPGYQAYAVLMKAGDGQRMPAPVLLVQGDFLALGPAAAQALVPFDAAFDRGGLVAVAPQERPRYAEALAGLLRPGGRLLLVTTEHDAFANGSLGPPFEVAEKEMNALFDKNFDVRFLRREDNYKRDAGIRARGCTRFFECAYLLTKKGQ